MAASLGRAELVAALEPWVRGFLERCSEDVCVPLAPRSRFPVLAAGWVMPGVPGVDVEAVAGLDAQGSGLLVPSQVRLLRCGDVEGGCVDTGVRATVVLVHRRWLGFWSVGASGVSVVLALAGCWLLSPFVAWASS